MNIILWILQGLLAAMMLMAGLMKLSSSKGELIKKGDGKMDWANDLTGPQIKTIGLLEFLAAIGLILPQLLNIVPILTPYAAIGVVLTMIGAIILHVKRKDESKTIATNLIILLVAAVIAVGRLGVI